MLTCPSDTPMGTLLEAFQRAVAQDPERRRSIPNPGRFMETHKAEILAALETGSPEEVAERYGLRQYYLKARIARWKDLAKSGEEEAGSSGYTDPPPVPVDSVPPDLVEGKRYLLRGYDSPLLYLGTSPGKTYGGRHFLFRGPGGWKTCFSVVPLIEAFRGEEEKKWKKTQKRRSS